EIVARIEAPGHTVGLLEYRSVWFPEKKMAVGIEGIASVEFQFHPRNSLLPVRVIAPIRCGSIDKDIGVMNDLGCSRQDFHRANEVRLHEGIGKNKVAKDIAAGGGERPGVRDGEDQIGLAHLPGCAV